MSDKIIDSVIDNAVSLGKDAVDAQHKKKVCKTAIDGATPEQKRILSELQQGDQKYKYSHKGVNALFRNGVIQRGRFVGTPNYVGNDFSEDLNDPTYWYYLTPYAEKYLRSK